MSGLSGLPAMTCLELLLPRPLQRCAVETQPGGRVDVGSRPQRPRRGEDRRSRDHQGAAEGGERREHGVHAMGDTTARTCEGC